MCVAWGGGLHCPYFDIWGAQIPTSRSVLEFLFALTESFRLLSIVLKAKKKKRKEKSRKELGGFANRIRFDFRKGPRQHFGRGGSKCTRTCENRKFVLQTEN